MLLTVDQALKQIHREYEGDINYPEFEDDETQLRVGYLKDSIREWGDRFPKFREIFALLSDAESDDGEHETTPGDPYLNCPENYVRPAGKIKVGDKYLTYIPPEKMEQKREENPNDEWYSITGSPGRYRIVLSYEPSGIDSVEYPYWRTPTQPELTTDPLEISRPLFCVYFVLAKLFQDDDPDRAKKFEDKMDDQERKERVALVLTPGQPNKVNTPGYGFGQTAPNDE